MKKSHRVLMLLAVLVVPAVGGCSGPAQESGLPSGAANLVDSYVGALNSRDAVAIQAMLGTGVISPADLTTEAARRIEDLGGMSLELAGVKITSQMGSLYNVDLSLRDGSGVVHPDHEAVITDAAGDYRMGTKYVEQTAPSAALLQTASTTS